MGDALGAIGGIVGGIAGGNAAEDAANAQVQAANAAAQVQRDMYNQNRQDQMPWLNMGTGALAQLGYLMGINPVDVQMQQAMQNQQSGTNTNTSTNTSNTPRYFGGDLSPMYGYGSYNPAWANTDIARENLLNMYGQGGNQAGAGGAANSNMPNPMANPYAGINQGMGGFGSLSRSFGMSDFQADPGYAFRMAEGQKALQRSAAAKGGLMSGAALKAINQYGQDLASQEYQNAYNRYNSNQTNLFNRLGSLAGVGQTSANTLGSLGQNSASNIANTMMDAGNARAGGIAGRANQWQSGLASLGSGLSSLFNGGGGGGNTYIDASSSLPWR